MKFFLLYITMFVLQLGVAAQQLQQRDLNTVDLDSVDIDTYSLDGELLVDELPRFKGKHSDFNAYIRKHLVYPEDARNRFIEGAVYVCYVIDRDGNIKDLQIIQSSNPALDKAALDVVAHSPKWKPATYKGKPVPYKKVSKVVFSI